jgi:uncharacterized protein (DUF433 family)
MQLEDYFAFVSPHEIRITGHRIGIEHVLAFYQDGYSPEAIAQSFPGLSLEKIYATITYYLHNKTDVDAYLARVAAVVEEDLRSYEAQEPSAVVQRLRALKAQGTLEQIRWSPACPQRGGDDMCC